MNEIRLYPCEPLRARITEAQCARNCRSASTASRYLGQGHGSGTMLSAAAAATCVGLQACIGCPGVVALAGKRRPEVLHGETVIARSKAAKPIRQAIAGAPQPRRLYRSAFDRSRGAYQAPW